MKRVIAALVIGSGVALAGIAQAQPCPWANQNGAGCPQGYGPYHGGMMMRGAPCWGNAQNFHHPRFGGFGYEERKTYMLGALNLADNQKAAWQKYSDALDAAHNVRTQRPQLGPDATRQDYLDARTQFLKNQVAALENLAKARADFVKVLTHEQAKVLDQVERFSHRGPNGRGYHLGFHHRAPMQNQAPQK